MSIQETEELLRICVEIKKSGPLLETFGICANTFSDGSPRKEILEKIFVRWPKFSGNFRFPVPSDSPVLSAQQAYEERITMWDRDTQYGRDRWELLDFIIAELEKDLEYQS